MNDASAQDDRLGATGPASGSGPGAEEVPGNFFDWIRNAGIRRSDARWLAGVCGGIAERTGLDPMIVRGIAAVIAVLGGPVFLAYAVGWALLPDSAGRIHLERTIKGVFDPAIIAIGVLVGLTFVPFMHGIWWQGPPAWWSMPGWLEVTLRTAWTLALIGGAIWLVIYLARRAPQAPRESARSHADFWTSAAEPQPRPERPSGTAQGTAAWAAGATGGAFAADAATDPGAARASARRATEERMAEWSSRARERNAQWNRGTEEWAARVRADSRVRAEEARRVREAYRRRRPGAAFVAIFLGVAVVSAAVSANVATRSPGLSDSALLIALAVGLAVIAVATVIAGIRGRDSGWLSFFGIVTVIALLSTGVFPRGTQLVPFGGPTWSVASEDESREQGYAIIAGGPTLDLTDLDGAPAGDEDGVIDVWMGAGNLTVVLPDDLPAVVEVNAFVGGIGYEQSGREIDRGGMFYQDEARFGRTASPDLTTVRVWTFTGHVDVETD